ncbi:MAG: phosphatidate cytidylyltransferase [Treponema sp.]|nr:phosphatidate cytidylyltransferase [Treponema sp.]
MSKLVQRLLTFFIGVPLVIGLVCLHPYHHLALHIVLILVSVCAALELEGIFSTMGAHLNKVCLAFLTALPPVMAFLCTLFNLPHVYIEYTLLTSIMLCMATEVITAQTFEHSNIKILSSAFIIFYSGYLPTFISRMTTLSHATERIALFLLLVFLCDSLAWLFGNLFGKNNRGIIKASPNKSAAGFAGGFFGSILISVLASVIMPDIFGASILRAVLLGILMAAFAIIGDLAESVFKRSANCKDSGSIIPGRGGVLDSIDSVFFSAPVYYLVTTLLYRPL